jgi:hypothetical protein
MKDLEAFRQQLLLIIEKAIQDDESIFYSEP